MAGMAVVLQGDIAQASVKYIKEQAKEKEPFFLYVGWSHVHYPALPHPDFEECRYVAMNIGRALKTSYVFREMNTWVERQVLTQTRHPD